MLQLFVLSVSDKMVCSKFRCQEVLLDKLVRMEFEVERFSKSLKERYDEIDELKNAARTELRHLQNDREAWKTDIETLKTKTERIETIKNEIDELKGAKAEFRQILQNDREAWKAEIETLKTESIEARNNEIDELKGANAELRQLLQNGRESWKAEIETLKTESIEARNNEIDELKGANAELRQLLQNDRESWKAEIETLKTESIEARNNEIDELKGANAELRQLLQNDRESWKAEIETLKTESIGTIKKQADFSQVYIRWGRKVCPGDAHLIYHGYAAGSYYTHTGGAADTQCLPRDPQWGNVHPGEAGSYLYGAEYEDGTDRSKSIFGKDVYQQDVPCAVCEVKGRKALNMFPARTSCYKGWHLEYNGYMMTSRHDHHRANVKCVDANPEVILGQGRNSNGDIFYFMEANGQLPTYTYTRGKELTCVVCTK